MSTIQKSFPHGKWVDYDTDSIISGLKSKLEIIAPNHLRIQDSALRFRVTFQYQKSARIWILFLNSSSFSISKLTQRP